MWFQSSSGPETGCNPCQTTATSTAASFQSSSGPETGCNALGVTDRHRREEFQSSSGPETGCNVGAARRVSILIRSGDRMQPSGARGGPGVAAVSILIRSGDRMQPVEAVL